MTTLVGGGGGGGGGRYFRELAVIEVSFSSETISVYGYCGWQMFVVRSTCHCVGGE